MSTPVVDLAEEDALPPLPSECKVPNDGMCWICRTAPADSREHRFKASNIKKAYGPGPYKGGDAPVRGTVDGPRQIQGPASKELTFPKLICVACNNARTAAADGAWDRFTDYVDNDVEKILGADAIDFNAVYGAGVDVGVTELRRYLGKHIGCRMREADLPISEALQMFVAGERTDWPGVQFVLEIRTDILELERLMREDGQIEPTLWVGTVTCSPNIEDRTVDNVAGFMGYRWLRINYWVRLSGPPNFECTSWVTRLRRGFAVDPGLVRARYVRSSAASD